jgi:phage shock protein A
MNLLERVLTLVRANLTTMVEKADDPEKVLQQLQLDMRNQLVQVKTQVATAIAESHKLQSRSHAKQAEADSWMRKVEQAIQQNNDDAARTALTRYNELLRLVQRYQQQQKEQEHIIATMRDALRKLEAKLAEVETTIDLLLARKRNALLQQRVFDTLSKAGTRGADKERTTRAQDAVLEAEARARALADLHKRDLDAQLDDISSEQAIEQQLHELKAKKRLPLLHEAGPQPSPLLHPIPQEGEPVKQSLNSPDMPEQGQSRGEDLKGAAQDHWQSPGLPAWTLRALHHAPAESTPDKEVDVSELKKLLE